MIEVALDGTIEQYRTEYCTKCQVLVFVGNDGCGVDMCFCHSHSEFYENESDSLRSNWIDVLVTIEAL